MRYLIAVERKKKLYLLVSSTGSVMDFSDLGNLKGALEDFEQAGEKTYVLTAPEDLEDLREYVEGVSPDDIVEARLIKLEKGIACQVVPLSRKARELVTTVDLKDVKAIDQQTDPRELAFEDPSLFSKVWTK